MTEEIIRVPKEFLKLNKDVFLTMDVFFVNKIPFLITLRRKIDFIATSHLPTKTARYIFKSFWRIYVFYLKRGFKITTFHADGEFDPVRELISEISSGPMVNLTIANEHVPEIEWIIRVVKERCRTTRNIISLMSMPVILTINIVLNNVKLLGYFAKTAGISTTISSISIMTGETMNYKRHLEIPIGEYFQIHE